MNKIINNKYLSGLLAGMLTVGIAQGSDGKENMSGLGDDQTPMVREQSISELPGDLRDLLLAFNQSLAEMGYQAQVSVNALQTPSQMTQLTLGETNEVQKEEPLLGIDLGGSTTFLQQTKVETDFHSAREMKERTQKNRVPLNEKGKIDPYSAAIVTQYMDAESIKTLQEVNSKYAAEREEGTDLIKIQDHGALFNKLKMNPSPITAKNEHLFSKIETQQIFAQNDHILEGMYRYVITYPVTKREIENWVTRLKDMHSGKALEHGKKPIVINCCKLYGNAQIEGDLSLVEIKKRKYFDTVVVANKTDLEKLYKETSDNIHFAKVVIKLSALGGMTVDKFRQLHQENIDSIEFDEGDILGNYRLIPQLVEYIMGCSRFHILKMADNLTWGTSEDVFLFAKQLSPKKAYISIRCHDSSRKKDVVYKVYAPFLEESCMMSGLLADMVHLPFLKRYIISDSRYPSEYSNQTTSYGERFTYSHSFDFNRYNFNEQDKYNLMRTVRRYPESQLQEIEKAKRELLTYIDSNPELVSASLNFPKPNNVSQEKWDVLMRLKNRLMALMRNETPISISQVPVIQFN